MYTRTAVARRQFAALAYHDSSNASWVKPNRFQANKAATPRYACGKEHVFLWMKIKFVGQTQIKKRLKSKQMVRIGF